ncbi:DUF370 domain-containing protein [Pelotomaculum terephthalicicum JT]|uniref:extracellular matrix regulator RemB n=1 Tax=Pelotomaculum terephthalicicum TaxID=206393 RepID=UPI001F04C0AC|nr:DUF370 domain-containing protein [Pelotomaculum terephthalicicum]MCG9966845.1 DUF370 domain-containing protein [Pelotomaculum terephthalicicum JT]
MFLHIGADVVVPKKDIIAILEIETKSSPITKEFLEIARDEGFIEHVSGNNKEKSYLITTDKIYFSPISCTTLKKRSDSIIDE